MGVVSGTKANEPLQVIGDVARLDCKKSTYWVSRVLVNVRDKLRTERLVWDAIAH